MDTVKEKLIKEIQAIHDEELLKEVYGLLRDITEANEVIVLNEAQKKRIEEARKSYAEGRTHTTEDIFNNLLGDE